MVFVHAEESIETVRDASGIWMTVSLDVYDNMILVES
jgi:hypothetical protein